MALRTDYQDQILNTSVNTSRQYEVTENDNNTISLTDVSVYSQEGDDFTAAIINTTNDMVNQLSVDYVVEEGTDANGWYVRKWNSGRMEATRYITNAAWSSATTIAGISRRSLTTSLDTPAFTTIDCCLADGNNSGVWVVGGLNASGEPSIFQQSVNSTSLVSRINIKLEGWS